MPTDTTGLISAYELADPSETNAQHHYLLQREEARGSTWGAVSASNRTSHFAHFCGLADSILHSVPCGDDTFNWESALEEYLTYASWQMPCAIHLAALIDRDARAIDARIGAVDSAVQSLHLNDPAHLVEVRGTVARAIAKMMRDLVGGGIPFTTTNSERIVLSFNRAVHHCSPGLAIRYDNRVFRMEGRAYINEIVFTVPTRPDSPAGSQFVMALTGDSVLFSDEDGLFYAVNPLGIVVCYRREDGRNTLVWCRHFGNSIHPLCRMLAEGVRPNAIRIMLACREFADANGGRAASRGNPFCTRPTERRIGLTREAFRYIFRLFTMSEMAAEMPRLSRNWRTAVETVMRDNGLTPPSRPVRRTWNWNRIPAEVLAIMERDLTLHLDEPMETTR